LNATAIPGFLKYPGLVVEKIGFRVVENNQEKRVSGSGKPGLETLILPCLFGGIFLLNTNSDRMFAGNFYRKLLLCSKIH